MRLLMFWAAIVAVVGLAGCTPKEAADLEPQDRDILFSRKEFVWGQSVPGQETVLVAGTLSGEGVGFRNNSVLLYCEQVTMDCWIIDIAQVGPNQVGPMIMRSYQVTQWDTERVVANSANLVLPRCRRETISIVKASETVVWVQEPINQSDADCLRADTGLYKWTIEDPPQWKAILERTR
jgi:hypothetical protein